MTLLADNWKKADSWRIDRTRSHGCNVILPCVTLESMHGISLVLFHELKERVLHTTVETGRNETRKMCCYMQHAWTH